MRTDEQRKALDDGEELAIEGARLIADHLHFGPQTVVVVIVATPVPDGTLAVNMHGRTTAGEATPADAAIVARTLRYCADQVSRNG